MTTVNGAELAEILGKSQNTITTWTHRGLPVKRNKAGIGHSYHTPHVIAWLLAKRLLEHKEIPLLSTLPMCLLGVAMTEREGVSGFATWKPHGLKLTKELGYTERDFDGALGELIETGLIVYAWPRTRAVR